MDLKLLGAILGAETGKRGDPHIISVVYPKWWAWEELNLRHPRYKRGALTPELHALIKLDKFYWCVVCKQAL